jgi:polysaccharide pyruvyl transferase WcaK-like protein
MTDLRKPRLAMVGFQGFGNIGDEALLTGIERVLDGVDARVETIFSGPSATTISAFPDARRMVTFRHLPTPGALRRLRRTDLLVLSGGGLFNDHWLTVVPRYAAWVLAARVSGARVAWLGVGIGPLRSAWSRWLTRRAADLSQLVLVRDAPSARLLGHFATVIPDPSLFNDRPSAIATASEIGLIVRAPAPHDKELNQPLVAALAEAAHHSYQRGLTPVVLTMAGVADDRFAARVLAEIERRSGVRGIRHERLGPNVADCLQRLARLRLIITVRLHGMLLGALAGVPSVSIIYDPKVRSQAAALGLDDLVVELDRVSGVALWSKAQRLLTDDRRAAVLQRVELLRARGPEVASLMQVTARAARR